MPQLTPSDALTGPRKPQLAVEIEGRDVRLIVMCANHYDAIRMYEELLEGCRNGTIALSMELKPRSD